MIRVYLADDHGIVRDGLRKVLALEADLAVVGEAADGDAALADPAQPRCDVLVLDLSLPKVSGLEVLRRLRAAHPALRVVVLSMYAEDQYAAVVRAEGATAYVSKAQPPADLVAAIRAAARGERSAQGPRAQDAAPPHATLTGRERQVFTLIIQGLKVSEVAAELGLSLSTVSNHLGRVKEKLGAHTVADVVAYAHRVGLV
jgi:DNA-binding NarL/FixJ family response regulator